MKEKLLQMRVELLSLVATSDEQAAIVELDQSKVGRLSRMDAMQAQAMAQETSQRRTAKLRDIAVALKRIEEGEFGLCITCDEAIDPRRLALDPTTSRCIDCANNFEGTG